MPPADAYPARSLQEIAESAGAGHEERLPAVASIQVSATVRGGGRRIGNRCLAQPFGYQSAAFPAPLTTLIPTDEPQIRLETGRVARGFLLPSNEMGRQGDRGVVAPAAGRRAAFIQGCHDESSKTHGRTTRMVEKGKHCQPLLIRL